jgi:hypothetical protein
VDYVVLVEVVETLTDLLDDDSAEIFGDRVVGLQELVELSSGTRFHYQVDIGSVGEETVHFGDMGVIEVHLYFYLAD